MASPRVLRCPGQRCPERRAVHLCVYDDVDAGEVEVLLAQWAEASSKRLSYSIGAKWPFANARPDPDFR